MNGIIILILTIINIPVYRCIFNMIFKDKEDFQESIRHSFTPDIISLFKGRYWKDQFGEMKIGMLLFGCIAVVAIEFFVIRGIINFIL